MTTNALALTAPVETGTAVATVQPRALGLLRPLAAPAEIMQQQEEVRKFIAETLKEGRDYGKVPGVDKPTLFKPGAERTCAGFGVIASFAVIEREVDHSIEVPWRKVKAKYEWHGRKRGKKIGEDVTEGVSYGLYRYVVECTLTHRETGIVLAKSLGSCSTLESKYIDRPRDCENTVLKMAEKRAFVGSTLIAFGLSEQFTQDVEDMPREQFARDGEEGDAGDARDPAEPEAKCPTCGGPMWDNRVGKTNPKAPDFKCKDRSCDGVYWPGQWPPKPGASESQIEALLTLTDRAECPEKVRAKVRRDLEKGISAEKAEKWIAEIDAKIKAVAAEPDWLAGEDAEEDAELARALGTDGNPQPASTQNGSTSASSERSVDASATSSPTTGSKATAEVAPKPAVASDVPPCPVCGGRMWDNRIGKRYPNAPDFKCRDRACDGVIWPAKEQAANPQPAASDRSTSPKETISPTGSDASKKATEHPESRAARTKRIRELLHHPAVAKDPMREQIERKLVNGMTEKELASTLKLLETAIGKAPTALSAGDEMPFDAPGFDLGETTKRAPTAQEQGR